MHHCCVNLSYHEFVKSQFRIIRQSYNDFDQCEIKISNCSNAFYKIRSLLWSMIISHLRALIN